jgi:predicted nucleic acid-binding protein
VNYLLDSNVLSDFYNSSAPFHRRILRRFERLSENDRVHISVLSLYELGYGLSNAPEDRKPLVRKQIRLATQDFEPLPLLPEAAELFGTLKKSLQTQRSLGARQVRRHNVDLMLAVTAIATDSILVSGDRGFENLRGLHPDLRHEDWTRP